MSLKTWLTSHFYRRKSFFDPTKNYSHLPQQLIKKFDQKMIIDAGAGEEKIGNNVITLDLYSKTDIQADVMQLPLKSNSVDLAFSIAVLEHLPEPYQAVQELYRILKPGGEVYLEIPFLQPFHSSPHDYYRATIPGLKHWCRHFQELQSGVCVGPGSAVAWLEIEYTKLWFHQLPLIGLPLEILFRLWTLPLKHLDRWLISFPDSHITASAIYFHGVKPARG